MKKIQLKGDVVSDYVGKLLDWFELDSIYPEKVRHMLENAGNEDVEITLTTNGGSVFAGQEIYDVIKNYEGKINLTKYSPLGLTSNSKEWETIG